MALLLQLNHHHIVAFHDRDTLVGIVFFLLTIVAILSHRHLTHHRFLRCAAYLVREEDMLTEATATLNLH